MRVGLISYPMLFQRQGGLQVQILETLGALTEAGVDARYFDIFDDKVTDYDIIHVFAAINGNHRIIEAAKDAGVPAVISTVLHPPFSRKDRWFCELAARCLGRLVGWSVTTSYHQIRAALDKADHIIALGRDEKAMLREGYGQRETPVSILPNGVNRRFFEAEPDRFQDAYTPSRRSIVCVASIDARKNQKTAATAIAGLEADLYLIGPCRQSNRKYLAAVEAAAPGKVHYLGPIPYDDPLLPSTYAAADVMILPSLSEVMPISVLEALAAGTPVVMTKNHSLDLSPVPGILEMVEPKDTNAIREACRRILDNPPDRHEVQALVRDLSWTSVARQLIDIYSTLTGGQETGSSPAQAEANR